MTIHEAFRNRGLLTPERARPYYRVTYGDRRCWVGTTIFQTSDWKTAESELQEKWKEYAERARVPEHSVLEIHCIPEEMAIGA